ncbi:uncharacterized protein HMPREF1541_05101 [Cyphellophora europaea CBS 101466]|uniref:Uncharacterized protein n=1 Tax=Cyphellophora europaea (strain CBS 101466) TaxID=1220924 RepID=W2RWD2_CYPE1|nr:uncharacterized protein HMPREF1541_05101 [Cyphellophora europaea CBS 101466]ETN40821.1 hypothetical protein HMPREF1541_05101 [Cyphellophora europaea CBS 101466]
MSPSAASRKPTVLITGCSDGSLGAALAIALSSTHRVFATARDPNKLITTQSAGVDILTLDVLSSTSITECVSSISHLTGGSLDMLVNNAGSTYFTALADIDTSKAKELFDLNVWAQLSVTQAFLPLLLASKRDGGAIIVNHTSTSSLVAPPFTAMYAASKAALAIMTDALRHELSPFGINVVDLKTSSTFSNLNGNQVVGAPAVPKGSLYWAARDWLNELYTGEPFMKGAMGTEEWGKRVAKQLQKRKPNAQVWEGGFPWLMWFVTWLPNGVAQKLLADAAGMPRVTAELKSYGVEKAVSEAYGTEVAKS